MQYRLESMSTAFLYNRVMALRTSVAECGGSLMAGSSFSVAVACGCAASAGGGCSTRGCSGGVAHAHTRVITEAIRLNENKLILFISHLCDLSIQRRPTV